QGYDASTSVRAHQGQPARTRDLRGTGRGNRRAHGQQGARAQRRKPAALTQLDGGHLAGTPRWPALGWAWTARTHARTALSGGPQHGDRGTLAHEQASAAARGGQPQALNAGAQRSERARNEPRRSPSSELSARSARHRTRAALARDPDARGPDAARLRAGRATRRTASPRCARDRGST